MVIAGELITTATHAVLANISGPENCMQMSIRSIRHMLRGKTYADRVFDNNFRGDFVAGVKKKGRGSRRNIQTETQSSQAKLLELTDAKVSVNPVSLCVSKQTR